MDDPTQMQNAAAARADVCDQIGRSVSSLWQRRSGVRPASVSTEYVGDVVRCQIREDDSSLEAASDEEDDRSIDSRGYRVQAAAAVERLTGRTVKAFIAKDSSEPATNAFILQPVRVKH